MVATAAQYQRLRQNPDWLARARARNATWCAAHRSVRQRQPWLIGAPPFWPHLPGVVSSLAIDPAGRWPLALRNVRHPHGAVCSLIDEPHGRIAQIAIFPWREDWWVYLASPKAAELAGSVRDVVLFNAPRRLTFGPGLRVKSPVVRRRGRQRVRLDAITPVSTRSAGVYRTCPEASHLMSSAAELARRIGAAHLDPEDLRAEVVERQTFPERVDVGGHWGVIRGWLGYVVLEVNAPMRWLLEVGSRIGIGGRVSIGFGRVAVTEVA